MYVSYIPQYPPSPETYAAAPLSRKLLMISLNWKTTLKFPPYPKLSAECTDLLASLLCEPEDRLGSNISGRGAMGIGNGTLTMRGKRGLGDDGSQAVKRHPWFSGMDWDCTYFLSPFCTPTSVLVAPFSRHPFHR